VQFDARLRPREGSLRNNIRIAFTLAIGIGLVGCGSGGGSGSDDVAARPDGATVGADLAAPADVGSADETAAPADYPFGGVEAGRETAVPAADASIDFVAVPLDLAPAADSLRVTPDAGAAEAASPMDVAEAAARLDAAETPSRPDMAEAAKPADAAAFDTAKPATDLTPATLGEMSPQQLHAALANKDFLLIDVHYPNAGSIPGTDARLAYDNIPALLAFIGPDLDTKVVLTCLMGGMSKSAGNALVALGYRNISELTGGMSAWTTAGYPLVHLDGGM
jgi:phage shock protein E